MSTYWDLYCKTCSVGAGFHWNHGDEQLVEVLKALPAIKAFADATRDMLTRNYFTAASTT